jgi:sulfite exporter TauE/SafE
MRDWHPLARASAIGLVTTAIPCGFLYGFVAVAGGTGSPVAGLLVMIVFWAGTLPVLAGLGFVADRALGALRARLPIVSASILIVLGLLTLAGRMHPLGAHEHPAAIPASGPSPSLTTHGSHAPAHGAR